MPVKPNSAGVKIIALCDSKTGYMYGFDIYRLVFYKKHSSFSSRTWRCSCAKIDYAKIVAFTCYRLHRNATLRAPVVSKIYNTFMRGVEVSDHLRSNYECDHQSIRWKNKVF